MPALTITAFNPDRITLVVVNNAMAYAFDSRQSVSVMGDNLFDMVQSVYAHGLPLNTVLYHQFWDSDYDITPKNAYDVEKISQLTGIFYLVTYPADPVTLTMIAVSVVVSLAVAFLMPMPQIPSGSNNQPPSPNNSLAQRSNQQRLGGRVPDIYGTIWSVADLIAVAYSVYIDHQEVEFSYMCVGRGFHNVTKAFDDTTPVEQIKGETVLVFDPNTDVWNNSPRYQFGASLTADEIAFANLAVKRYTSVNGQAINPMNDFISVEIFFSSGGYIYTNDSTVDFRQMFTTGETVTVSNADKLASANTPTDASGNPIVYNMNGSYPITDVAKQTLHIQMPAGNADWDRLNKLTDDTKTTQLTVSVGNDNSWIGWFYTDSLDHDDAFITLKAPNGIYQAKADEWAPLEIFFTIESELVDSSLNFIAGTNQTRRITFASPNAAKHKIGNAWQGSTDDRVRQEAAMSVFINNPAMGQGKRLRFRIRRDTPRLKVDNLQILQDVRLADFFGVKAMAGRPMPQGVTTVYTKTVATEGALSGKERKTRLQVQRYVRDWQNNNALKLSNRIDDIIYDIATDPLTGGLTLNDLNMPQIKAEVDAQIGYFGTDLCAQFCGTFDNTDVTTEEMIQTVAQAGFFQAYRINNQIHLHFEKIEPLSVVQFNSHNMLPDSFDYSESFGARNDFDGMQVTYTDPVDDARVTLNYPAGGSANPDKQELVGVHNKTQAYMHLMRKHWKNQLAYKSCEFTAADESGIVIPSNRIDVANQNMADVQQGVIEKISVNAAGRTVVDISEPANLPANQSATIFVQTVSGVVDNIACTVGDNAYQLVLSRQPAYALSTSPDAVVQAVYKLITHSEFDRDSYIVTAKEIGSNALSHKLTCINYTDKYYQNDSDFINNAIPMTLPT